MKGSIEQTIKKALTNVLGAIRLFLVVATVVCIVLSPGIIVNNIRGRYNGSRGPIRIWPAVKDWQTWLISIPIVAALYIFLSNSEVFNPSRPSYQVGHRPQVTPSDSGGMVATPKVEVRRAIADPEAALPSTKMQSSSQEFPTDRGGENAGPQIAIPRAKVIAKPSLPLAPFQVQPADAPPEARVYSVIGVPKGDMLNVRNGPGVNNQIVARLPDGFENVHIIGTSVINDTTEWVKISFGNRNGWVVRQHLTDE